MTEYDPAKHCARLLRHFADDNQDRLTQAEKMTLEDAQRVLRRHPCTLTAHP